MRERGRAVRRIFSAVCLGSEERGREDRGAARRHFLLLFDLAFSNPTGLAKAQTAARDMLEGLHPSDLMAVASYSPFRGDLLKAGAPLQQGGLKFFGHLDLLPGDWTLTDSSGVSQSNAESLAVAGTGTATM